MPQKCEKLAAAIKDDFSDPNKPFFCVRDHQIVPYIGLCSCQISDHLNNSLRIRFEHLCKKTVILISQTKPEISPKIGAKSKASMIRSQPYITLPYLSKKSGTSVDVKVDVKNVTEPEQEPEGTRLGFLLGYKVFPFILPNQNYSTRPKNLMQNLFNHKFAMETYTKLIN